MQTLNPINEASMRHVQATAKNALEAYRVIAQRGVALELKFMNAGVAVVSERFAMVEPLLGSVARVNKEANTFAGAVVDGLTVQASAVVDGLANIANQLVVKNFGGVDGTVGAILESAALPIAKPIRAVAERAELVSEQVLARVRPAVAKSRKAGKRFGRSVRRGA